MTRARFGPIDQIGIVVEDINGGIQAWMQRMGVGPWMLFRNVRIEGEYRGRHADRADADHERCAVALS
jgi:methylmalonyl-CoA/ethylmalonyl-CoA epimerase